MVPLALALAESGAAPETRFLAALAKAMGRLLRHSRVVSILLAIPFCVFQ